MGVVCMYLYAHVHIHTTWIRISQGPSKERCHIQIGTCNRDYLEDVGRVSGNPKPRWGLIFILRFGGFMEGGISRTQGLQGVMWREVL